VTSKGGSSAPGAARPSCWARAALVLFGLAVGLLGAEGLLRLVHPVELHPTDTFLSAAGRSPLQRGQSAARWLRPHMVARHVQQDFDVEVRINSAGLRDREIPHAKPAGTRRVLVLGDSFTFGYGVELDQSFVKVAQRMLGPGWEAINGGAPTWGTGDDLDFLRAEGLRYEPDLVVVGFFRNDLADNWLRGVYYVERGTLRRLPAEPAPKRHTPAASPESHLGTQDGFAESILDRGAAHEHAASVRGPHGPVRWLTLHSHLWRLGREAASRAHQRRRRLPAPGDEVRGTQRELAGLLLAEIARVAAAEGARTMVVLIPERCDMEDAEDRAVHWSDVTAPARTAGAMVLDLAPALRRAGRTALYFDHDPHLNAAGHAVAGREIARAIEKLEREGGE